MGTVYKNVVNEGRACVSDSGWMEHWGLKMVSKHHKEFGCRSMTSLLNKVILKSPMMKISSFSFSNVERFSRKHSLNFEISELGCLSTTA